MDKNKVAFIEAYRKLCESYNLMIRGFDEGPYIDELNADFLEWDIYDMMEEDTDVDRT